MSGMVVAHNLQSMFSNRALGIVNDRKAKSSEKLASGYRINRAADDAAGLSISEKMRKKIRGLNQGADNMQDGVSLCQIADGALAETQDLLQRMNELCIKSANGTMSASDRQDVQNEIGNLKEEIDRIANTTSFNNFIYPLKGGPYKITTESAANVDISEIELMGFDEEDVNVGSNPFGKYDDANHLNLQAVVNKPGSTVDGKTFDLIYGQGSTSYSSIKVKYDDGSSTNKIATVNFSDMNVDPESYKVENTSGGTLWSREFSYTDDSGNLAFKIKQRVFKQPEEKQYYVYYDFTNTGSYGINKTAMMINYDSAYNNDDYNEEQFVNGNKVSVDSLFYSNNASLASAYSDMGLNDLSSVVNKTLAGESVANGIEASHPGVHTVTSINKALPFTERFSYWGADIMLSVGHWTDVDKWSYYNNIEGNVGNSTAHKDLAVSAIMVHDDTYDPQYRNGSSIGMFQLKLESFKDFAQTQGIPENKISWGTITKIEDQHGIDIQCSDEVPDRINIPLVIATAEGIGLEGKEGTIDASTLEGARKGIDLVSKALLKVNEYRTNFGVHQNRLEHAIKVNDNSSENTQAAESRIRDTDMASEMVKYSRESILQQAGQSMLAQANQQPQGILQLLQ